MITEPEWVSLSLIDRELSCITCRRDAGWAVGWVTATFAELIGAEYAVGA